MPSAGYLRSVGTVVRSLVDAREADDRSRQRTAHWAAAASSRSRAISSSRHEGRRSSARPTRSGRSSPTWAAPTSYPASSAVRGPSSSPTSGISISAADAAAMGLVNRCRSGSRLRARRPANGPSGSPPGPGARSASSRRGLLASPLFDLDAALEWEANAIALSFATEDLARGARRLPGEATAPLRRALAVGAQLRLRAFALLGARPWEPRRSSRTPRARRERGELAPVARRVRCGVAGEAGDDEVGVGVRDLDRADARRRAGTSGRSS